jgi:hypothetical protein
VISQHGESEGDQDPALRVTHLGEAQDEAGDGDASSVGDDIQP